MKLDPATGAAVPALGGAELLAHDPGLRRLAEIEVLEFGQYPGPHMNLERMWAVSEILRKELERPDLCGAVVTHGTDTLEETAYLLDLRHTSEKPVAVVGAMRTISESGFDGPANLSAALRMPDGGGMAWYVMVPERARLAADITDGACTVNVKAVGEDGGGADGKLVGTDSAVDLSSLAGKAVRLELTASDEGL